MRKFSSYGPVDPELHYYAPRTGLIDKAYKQLIGEDPEKGGHYITVWAPRQTGKSWLMLEVVKRLKKTEEFDAAIISVESAKYEKSETTVLEILSRELSATLGKDFPQIDSWKNFPLLFTPEYLSKPLILIIDEFDAIEENFINKFASEFRNMYLTKINEPNKKSSQKRCLLHGLALIGVRSVLGIENVTGSPFNVQRSLHIPNLTYDEVEGMFTDYENETGHRIEQDVVQKLYYETKGQPGLTCWFGELLSEGYENHVPDKNRTATMKDFEIAYAYATDILPNNNILNIISKSDKEPYRNMVLELFKTDEKIPFKYDNSDIAYLYMNGVIDREQADETKFYVKFSSPFVQKRLFNYFSNELFRYMGKLVEPFESLADVITEDHLNIRNLMRQYEKYLKKNREWLLKDAPRRKDLRIYEAVFHFNLYMYLFQFLAPKNGNVYPEFPTGNGKIDIIIKYSSKTYGLELKTYTDETAYRDALTQAAQYGRQLRLAEIFLIFFVEYIDDENRRKYEADYQDKVSQTKVVPVFIETGM
ncbi:MAG: AAA-like domain-containing protein [Desulfococcaceae bacterium]